MEEEEEVREGFCGGSSRCTGRSGRGWRLVVGGLGTEGKREREGRVGLRGMRKDEEEVKKKEERVSLDHGLGLGFSSGSNNELNLLRLGLNSSLFELYLES